jgi:hypothetical protein
VGDGAHGTNSTATFDVVDPRPPPFRPVLGLLVVALAGLAFAIAAGPAGAAGKHHSEPLVVRGDATAVDGPCDASGVCLVELTGGSFRGTPVGTGAYEGSIKLRVADTFPNGEGGICAPLKARIELGVGTRNRLILGVRGVSCQDGSGPLETASFTGLAEFNVRYGTGRYAGASGGGQASFLEDAANHHRMTLIGRIAR